MPQLRLFVLSLAALVAAPVFGAASYPERPIRMIVPFPPGGGTDALARILVPKLGESLGQQVLVDNRGGAQGGVGTAVGAKAAPDGYTLVFAHSGALTINPHMYSNLGYNTLKDFAAVSRGTEMPYILVLHPSVPAKSMKELAALARAHPGQLSFASTSAGPQLMGELFRTISKTQMVHVPYKGAGPAVSDLLGGHVSIMFTVPSSVGGHIRSGKLKAVGVSGTQREESLPDVPTMTEAGLPGFESYTDYALYAPAGTPKAIVARLNKETNVVLQLADLRAKLDGIGIEVAGSTPEALQKEVVDEIAKWTKVIKDANIKQE